MNKSITHLITYSIIFLLFTACECIKVECGTDDQRINIDVRNDKGIDLLQGLNAVYNPDNITLSFLDSNTDNKNIRKLTDTDCPLCYTIFFEEEASLLLSLDSTDVDTIHLDFGRIPSSKCCPGGIFISDFSVNENEKESFNYIISYIK